MSNPRVVSHEELVQMRRMEVVKKNQARIVNLAALSRFLLDEWDMVAYALEDGKSYHLVVKGRE